MDRHCWLVKRVTDQCGAVGSSAVVSEKLWSEWSRKMKKDPSN
jgi:hypothetical protein